MELVVTEGDTRIRHEHMDNQEWNSVEVGLYYNYNARDGNGGSGLIRLSHKIFL